MELVNVIIMGSNLCCERCGRNLIELDYYDGTYSIGRCPICGAHVMGIEDETHFWKMGELINQTIKNYSKERFE